jgi:hypothetical protein
VGCQLQGSGCSHVGNNLVGELLEKIVGHIGEREARRASLIVSGLMRGLVRERKQNYAYLAKQG